MKLGISICIRYEKLAVPTSSSKIHNLISFRRFERFQSQLNSDRTEIIGLPKTKFPCRCIRYSNY